MRRIKAAVCEVETRLGDKFEAGVATLRDIGERSQRFCQEFQRARGNRSAQRLLSMLDAFDTCTLGQLKPTAGNNEKGPAYSHVTAKEGSPSGQLWIYTTLDFDLRHELLTGVLVEGGHVSLFCIDPNVEIAIAKKSYDPSNREHRYEARRAIHAMSTLINMSVTPEPLVLSF